LVGSYDFIRSKLASTHNKKLVAHLLVGSYDFIQMRAFQSTIKS